MLSSAYGIEMHVGRPGRLEMLEADATNVEPKQTEWISNSKYLPQNVVVTRRLALTEEYKTEIKP